MPDSMGKLHRSTITTLVQRSIDTALVSILLTLNKYLPISYNRCLAALPTDLEHFFGHRNESHFSLMSRRKFRKVILLTL